MSNVGVTIDVRQHRLATDTTTADVGEGQGTGAEEHGAGHDVGYRVAWISIANQARLNCLSTAVVNELRTTFEAVSQDETIRCVVLTGAGDKAFIGGADLNELRDLDAAGARLYITNLSLACRAVRACPHPVIARINGFCLGGGLEVAASCDMRVAGTNAVFGMPEVHMGLPSVIEAALLPGLIGWGKTRELLLTGDTFDADAALAMQFVQKAVPPTELDAAVDAWVQSIALAAPGAVRAQKALMNHWQKVSVDEGVLASIDCFARAYEGGEPAARIAAFFAARRKLKRREA